MKLPKKFKQAKKKKKKEKRKGKKFLNCELY